ncbi:MAG: cytidylate kinase-like family protein [Planctomycetota bacterium]|jgi:cytidylate kinase
MTAHEAIVESHISRWLTRSQLSIQAQKEKDKEAEPHTIPPSITFSIAYGSGAHDVVKIVATKLGYQVLDREIIDGICQSTPIQRRIIEALDKGDRSVVPSMPEQIFTRHFIDDTRYLNTLIRVVRFISMLGPMIFIGRGACHVLRETEALNVRIIANYEDRVERVVAEEGLARAKVEAKIYEEDEMRERFIRNYFKKEIDDPTVYHMVLNTSRISEELAAGMVIRAYQAIEGSHRG